MLSRHCLVCDGAWDGIFRKRAHACHCLGSGPAYFFLLVESIAAAAVELGLPADVARNLAAQTCLGAGRMMIDGDDEPAELRRKVTSPNGTTEAAIKSFEADGFREIAKKAIVAATKRGEELGDALSKVNSARCSPCMI